MNAPKVTHRGFDPDSGELKYTIGDRLYEAQGVSPFQNKKFLSFTGTNQNKKAIEYMKPFDPKFIGIYTQAYERIASQVYIGSLLERLRQDLAEMDTRAPEEWSDRELEIQRNSEHKDSSFRLSGSWKKFHSQIRGFNVYSVDRDWVRTNLTCDFNIGGHGYVHEPIPHDEIWVSRTLPDGRGMSVAEFLSTALHEIVEHEAMKNGSCFFDAHRDATLYEIGAGLIPVPL